MFSGAAAFVIAKFAMHAVDGMVFACIVSGWAALFCGVWAKIDGNIAPPSSEGRLRWLFAGHVIASVVGAGSLWCAIDNLDPAVVSIVSRVEIIISLILAAIFLRERFRPMEWFGAVVVITGLVILKLASTGSLALVLESAHGRGFLFSLMAGLGYASSEVFAKSIAHTTSPPALAFYRNFFMMLLFGCWVAIRGGASMPEPRVWGIVAAAAVTGPGIARILWFQALRLIPLSRAVLLAQTHPLWTALLASFVLGTSLTAPQWGGAVVLLAGCVIVATGGAQRLAA
ncbi:MAG: hypothetical protein COB53_12780, partial [Elusimicrobia bacterium]